MPLRPSRLTIGDLPVNLRYRPHPGPALTVKDLVNAIDRHRADGWRKLDERSYASGAALVHDLLTR